MSELDQNKYQARIGRIDRSAGFVPRARSASMRIRPNSATILLPPVHTEYTLSTHPDQQGSKQELIRWSKRLLATAGTAWAYEEHTLSAHVPQKLTTSAQQLSRVLQRKKQQISRQLMRLPRPVHVVFDWLQAAGSAVTVAVVVLLSIAVPAFQNVSNQHRYTLTAADEALVGKASSNLTAKLTYDAGQQLYQFNKDGLAKAQAAADPSNPVAKLMQKQVGGDAGKSSQQLYSVDLPSDLSKGITIYDNNSGLSFKLIPDFGAAPAQMENGHVVYPINGGTVVYTLKGNGLKEDVVLNQAPAGGAFALDYHLQLPAELAARAQSDGSLGVYSADQSFYGDISYGDKASEQKVMQARKTGAKTNLVFGLPAPVIKQSGGKTGQGSAAFHLDGNALSLQAKGLASNLSYPISIDPSVVVTSTSDFSAGNNDGDIDFSTAGQITRGGLTGGTVGTWSTGSALPVAMQGQGSVAYNGYLYEVGGYNSNTLSNVYYAAINANGSLGAWTATSSLAVPQTSGVAEYNGYLYIVAGTNDGGMVNITQYAKIGTNGTVGAWGYTTPLGLNRQGAAVEAYNGYLYALGGYDGSNMQNTVSYATINANGSLGAWVATSAFNGGRNAFGAAVYNGFIYIMGGNEGYQDINDVQYAPINADGSLGTWVMSANSFANVRHGDTGCIYNGYLYVDGGGNYNDVQYAPVNANGSIGAFNTTTAFSGGRQYQPTVFYNGYMYISGGYNGSNSLNDVQYAKIDAPGSTSTYTTTTVLPQALYGAASVAYNGYLYELGGNNGSGSQTVTYYAPLNTNGTIGTWATGTVLPQALFYESAAVYNGYVYVLGGFNNSLGTAQSTTYYAPLNTDGTIGTWNSTTALPSTLYQATSAVNNGYIYELGGVNSSGGTKQSATYYAPLNTDGTIGTWITTTVLPQALVLATTVVNAGYIYELGGTSGANQSTTYYAPLNSNGSIGTWTSTTALPTALTSATTVVSNGYIYELGGTNGSAQSTVYDAMLNTNGTIGTWASLAPLAQAVRNATTIAYNGILYQIGGLGSSATAATYYAQLNNGGAGTTGSATATTSFTNGRTGLGSVAYNGYLYILGGYNSSGSSYYNDVQYAKINNDGTLGSFAATTSFTNGRSGLVTTVYNGYIYVIGGQGNSVDYNDVQYAPINANGTIGTWATTTSFAGVRQDHGAVMYSGYVYVYGGYNTSTYLNDVQYAPINANGTIGTWATTTSFANGRSSFATVAYNGYLYIIAGQDSTTYYGDVQYAPINANGTIGTWATTTSLAYTQTGSKATVSNGYLYISGGFTSSYVRSNAVQYAAIGANGTIGTINTTVGFSNGRSAFGSVIYNGYMYTAGGYNNSYLNDVQVAPLNVIARIAHYSKLIDLGSLGSLTSFGYTGTLPGGLSSISYKAYGADGATVVGSGLATALVAGTGSTSCKATGTGTIARYVQLSVTIDDSRSGAVFPDSLGSNIANLQDMTVNYAANLLHPTPQTRLHLGKTVQESKGAAPLDTCGATAAYVPAAANVVGTTTYNTSGYGGSGGSIVVSSSANTLIGDLVLIESYVEPANEGTGTATYGTLTIPGNVTVLPGFPINTDDSQITTGDTHRLYVWYTYATANGAANYTFSDNQGIYSGFVTATIRGGPTSGNPLAVAANTNVVSRSASPSTTPAVSLTVPTANTLVLWVYGDWDGGNPGYPSGYNDVVHEASNAGQPAMASHLYTSAGSTGTVTASRGGADDGMTAALLAIPGR